MKNLSQLIECAGSHPWRGVHHDRHDRAAHSASTAPWNLLGLPVKAALMSAAVIAGIAPAHGGIFLTGSGAHLPLGPIVGSLATAEPGIGPTYTSVPHTSFAGTWGASVLPAWQGSFTGTGPLPFANNPSGTSLYDFSGLPGGQLSAGTYFAFGDLDNGSGVENITLKAFGVGGAPLATEWLYSPPAVVRGSGSGSGGLPLSTDLAGWSWNSSTFEYSFAGSTVPGNPTIAFYLESGLAMSSLMVTQDNSNSAFNIAAPSAVPEPSEYAAIAGMALVAFGAWRRTRRPAATMPADSAIPASAL